MGGLLASPDPASTSHLRVFLCGHVRAACPWQLGEKKDEDQEIDAFKRGDKEAAKKLDFEDAANLRDRIKQLRQKMAGKV